MPPITRAVSRELFNTFVTEYLDRPDSTDIGDALSQSGIDNIEDFVTTPNSDIDELTVRQQGAGQQRATTTPLTRGHKQRIKLLLQWLRNLKQANNNQSLSEQQYRDLTVDAFNEFRLNLDPNVNPTTVVAANNVVPVVNNARLELDSFKRGIKRDAALYPTLRDDKSWDNWNRGMQAQARTHDVSDVLNPDYVPEGELATELFSQKQSFMYSVLNRVVLTDMGKTIVRQHETTFNAQAVYRDLVEHAKKSTAANISIENIVEFLTITKLDSRWQGTTTGFILHWRDRMRMLEELTPIEEHYSDGVKKRMLEAAVRNIPELRQVKVQDEHTRAIGGESLTYQAYVDLLISAATRRDSELKLPPQRTRRNVHAMATSYGFDEADFYQSGYVDGGEAHFGVDDYQDDDFVRQVFVMEQNRRRIPPDIWRNLPREAQDIILKQRRSDNSSSTKPNNSNANYSQPSSNSTPRFAKLHISDFDPPYDYEYEYEYEPEVNQITANMANVANEQEETELALSVNKSDRTQLHPGDIQNVLSTAHKSKSDYNKQKSKNNVNSNSGDKDYIVLNGKKYYAANTMFVTYSSFNQVLVPSIGSLVDRGANGGIAGDDVILLEKTHRTCDVSGIDNHTISDLPIATCAGLVQSNIGPVIVILHQYAYAGKGKTIHSSAQVECFGNTVDDRSVKVKDGKQHIVTSDGMVLPLHFRQGLPYLDMTKPTSQNMADYPHIVLTSDQEWNPSCLDCEGSFELDTDDLDNNNTYTSHYSNVDITTSLVSKLDSPISHLDLVDTVVDVLNIASHSVTVQKPHYEALRPNFGWAPLDIVKKTFEHTTQWAKMNERYPFRKHFKSRFPALNVIRRNEAVATDTVFSDTPAVANGCRIAQVFVGCKTFVTDVYPMKLEAHFVDTLQDNIRQRGAMDKLVSDRAQVEISNRVKDILRLYVIDDSQSEPYHEHQNPAERRYQTLKRYTNTILERTGAPASTWLLCMQYVAHVLNLTYVERLNTTPLQALTGQTQDISILLPFTFWEPVYFATADALSYSGKVSFPSETAEDSGRFVGFGINIGDALTFKILTDNSQRIIYRSSVRSAKTTPPNLRLEPPDGEIDSALTTANNNNVASVDLEALPMGSVSSDHQAQAQPQPIPIVPSSSTTIPDTTSLDKTNNIVIGLVNSTLDQRLPNSSDSLDESLGQTRDNMADDLVAYNDVLDHLEHQHDNDCDPEDVRWEFEAIVGHEGPLQPLSPGYKGSKYNVLVKWGDGTQTFEPLNTVAQDDPVSCALYAKAHDLLDMPGWKRFKPIISKQHKLKLAILAAKRNLKSKSSPVYKFGSQVPRSVNEAYEIDRKNGNTKWTDAMQTELNQIHEYKTFKSLGKGSKPPEGYKRIRVHFVFDVKHNGRHKARLVAGGHMTEEPDNSIYSGVVSLRSLRLVVFAGELNGLDIWGADVGNAYLESYTKEQVYIIAGPEFNELEGCTLLIDKALYGLRSSGLRWHERFADTLRDLGFKPCKADGDVWMRKQDNHYEYIAVYVDDLAIVAKEPKTITDILVNKYKYKLKGVGPIDYHLGANFGRDGDGTLRYGPRKYIDKLILAYDKMFGGVPTGQGSPLVKGDHPELDDTPELDSDGIKRYQSMIGALQWTVSLGRFDILAAVMTMSRFRIAPRIGHLDRLKRIYGYLKKFKYGDIRFRTGLPDYSQLKKVDYDWSSTVYNDANDEVPSDLPEALGNKVITTTYVDANLMHCMITGRASTGVLHLVNGTPVDWYSKRQATVETATYGSEFVAARIATDQVIDLRLTLAYMGITVVRSVMFGDNQSVVTSSTIPHSKLNKRHVALSYHRVREAIAGDVLQFYHIDGTINPADMLSKHAGNQQFWPILRSLLFWGVSFERAGKNRDSKNEDEGKKNTHAMVGSET